MSKVVTADGRTKGGQELAVLDHIRGEKGVCEDWLAEKRYRRQALERLMAAGKIKPRKSKRANFQGFSVVEAAS